LGVTTSPIHPIVVFRYYIKSKHPFLKNPRYVPDYCCNVDLVVDDTRGRIFRGKKYSQYRPSKTGQFISKIGFPHNLGLLRSRFDLRIAGHGDHEHRIDEQDDKEKTL